MQGHCALRLVGWLMGLAGWILRSAQNDIELLWGIPDSLKLMAELGSRWCRVRRASRLIGLPRELPDDLLIGKLFELVSDAANEVLGQSAADRLGWGFGQPFGGLR